MLFGEHAVIHNYPCLVTAVDQRVQVSVEAIDDPVVFIDTPHLMDQGESISIPINKLLTDQLLNPHTKFIVASIQKVFSRFKIQQGLRIRTSGLVNSFGLGSSSAVTVATVFSLLNLFNIPYDNQLLFDLSFLSVLEVQKLGSGFDVASAIYGGTLYYKTDQKPEVLKLDKLPLIIGYSGSKVSTINLVQEVENLRIDYPEIIEQIFKTIGKVTESARTAIIHNDWKTLGSLANINQGLLDGLGVNTPCLSHPIFEARRSGAFGAKLSGAGGGDCMFAIVDEKTRSKVEMAIESSGAKVLQLKTNTDGVRLES